MMFYNSGTTLLDENIFFLQECFFPQKLKDIFTKVKCNMVQIRYHDLDKLVDLGMNQISRNLSVTEMPVLSICVLKVNDCFPYVSRHWFTCHLDI